MAERQLVKAFRIKACVGWMPNVMGEGPSAACVITCECGHSLSVNDAWGRVYEPKQSASEERLNKARKLRLMPLDEFNQRVEPLKEHTLMEAAAEILGVSHTWLTTGSIVTHDDRLAAICRPD
jgi:hypothetical protein